MTFIHIKQLIDGWLKSKKNERFIQEQQITDLLNQYFQKRKNWPKQEIKANLLNQGQLIIRCRHGFISSEMKLDELRIKKYLEEKLPGIKINKIFYKIK